MLQDQPPFSRVFFVSFALTTWLFATLDSVPSLTISAAPIAKCLKRDSTPVFVPYGPPAHESVRAQGTDEEFLYLVDGFSTRHINLHTHPKRKRLPFHPPN